VQWTRFRQGRSWRIARYDCTAAATMASTCAAAQSTIGKEVIPSKARARSVPASSTASAPASSTMARPASRKELSLLVGAVGGRGHGHVGLVHRLEDVALGSYRLHVGQRTVDLGQHDATGPKQADSPKPLGLDLVVYSGEEVDDREGRHLLEGTDAEVAGDRCHGHSTSASGLQGSCEVLVDADLGVLVVCGLVRQERHRVSVNHGEFQL